MPFVVEDGYGLAGANSYATVDEVTEYHTSRGNSTWTSEEASPSDFFEAAIVRATAFIDGAYRARFPGSRKNGRAQGLEWPRSDAEDIYGDDIAETEIPIELKQAVAEAALRELTSPGSLTPDYIASEKVIQEQVGALSVTYSDKNISSGPESVLPVVSVIDRLLAPLIGEQKQFLFGGSRR